MANYRTKDGIVLRNVPDGTPEEAIKARIAKIRAERVQQGIPAQRAANPAEYDPASPEYQAKYGAAAVPGTENRVAGMGKFFSDVGFGVKQRATELFGSPEAADALRAEAGERRERDAPLMDTVAGKIGYFGGGGAAAIPLAVVPGANTTAGAALTGGLLGLSQPSESNIETALNVGLGAAGGAAGQKIGEKVGGLAQRKIAERTARAATAKSQSSVRDATLAQSRAAGYVVPPATTNPTVTNRILESVSGKAATQQAAAIKNQRVTDSIARRELGLGADAPLTAETLQGIRANAGKVYQEVASAGVIKTDDKFRSQIASLTAQSRKIEQSFPGAKASNNEAIAQLQETANREAFDSGAAIEFVKKLREEAKSNLAWNVTDPAAKALGKAQRRTADILEDQMDRALREAGKGDLVAKYRDARTMIAKSYTVENALAEGTGNVNAGKLAAELKKHRPLSGGLKTAAKFAQVAPRAAAVPNTSAGVSALDTYASAVGGTAVNPAFFGLPLARIGARATILSRPYQNALAVPSYSPNVNALRALSAGAPLAQPAGILIGTNVGQ